MTLILILVLMALVNILLSLLTYDIYYNNICIPYLIISYILLTIPSYLKIHMPILHMDAFYVLAYMPILALVLLSVILTGFNLFSKIVDFGGAGALVPITGFANSVAAPAVEYKTEGQVFGIGCKIFTIAGPVILYGIVTSWVVGLIYWIGKGLGVF